MWMNGWSVGQRLRVVNCQTEKAHALLKLPFWVLRTKLHYLQQQTLFFKQGGLKFKTRDIKVKEQRFERNTGTLDKMEINERGRSQAGEHSGLLSFP